MPRRPTSEPAAPPREPGLVTSPFAARYRVVTIGMVALVGLAAFEALAVTTVMPVIVRSLGGLELYAMAFAGPMASGLAGMVAGGTWSDRRGPVRPLYVGVGLFVAGLLVAGSATTMGTLVAGRVVQGLGSGMLTVALYVVVARLFPDAVQPRLFAAFSAAWVLPALVGPAIAGAIADTVGWRWVFLAVPVLAVPAVLLLRPALRSIPPVTAPDDDAARAVGAERSLTPEQARLVRAVGAGVGLLLLQLGGRPGDPTEVLASLAGIGLLAVTVPRLLPAGTLRAARGIPAVIALRGLLASAFFGAEVYLPLLLTTERGLSASRAGLALTVGAVSWSTGSWLRGRAEGRWEDRAMLRAGAVAIAAGIGAAALALAPGYPVAAAIAGWGLAGLGMGLSYPTLALLTLRLSAPSEQGGNTAALQLNESLANALVLAVTGPVVAALVATRPTAAYLAAFGVSIALATTGLVVAGHVPRRTPPA